MVERRISTLSKSGVKNRGSYLKKWSRRWNNLENRLQGQLQGRHSISPQK